jgi:uncharacterized protein (DUF1330 family)
MAAYVIAELESVDVASEGVARLARSPRTGRFGERTLADTNRCETLAGGWSPQRMVLLEFPTLEAAHSWWEARERSAPAQMAPVKRNMVLVPGL